MQSFTESDEWLDVFGERLIMQKPEDMELFPAVEKGFSYLMLFSDDIKIDLTLLPLELTDEYFRRDKLVKLLLDKDSRICQPPLVRKELLRMISWLVGIEHGFHFSLGKNCKFLDRYIPEKLWERLMITYRMDSYVHMWESLEQCVVLFRETSAEVARRINYSYPPYDEKISAYVARQKAKYLGERQAQ